MQRHDDAAPVAEDYSKASTFVRFDTPLFEAVTAGRFKPAQRQVVMSVIGRTYDFESHRAGKLISVWMIREDTRLSERAVKNALRDLITGGVLIEVAPRAGTRARKLAIQPDSAKWGEFTPKPKPERQSPDGHKRAPVGGPEVHKRAPETGTSVPQLTGTSVPQLRGTSVAPIKEEESKNIEDSSSLEDAAAWGAAATSQEENEEPAAESVLTREEGKAKVSDYLAKKREEKRRAAMDHGLGVVSDGTA